MVPLAQSSQSLWFHSWQDLWHVALAAAGVYVALVVMIRITGKRATSRMNNFDWIVTVAVGAIAGRTALSGDTAVVEGLAARATLFGLQCAVNKAASHGRLIVGRLMAQPRPHTTFIVPTPCQIPPFGYLTLLYPFSENRQMEYPTPRGA